MRVLIATARTQGWCGGDYFTARAGEFVWVPGPCVSALVRPSGPVCACTFSFGGALSCGATTTALIVESDLSRREVVRMFVEGCRSREWPVEHTGWYVDRMLAVAASWPTGTVLGRRDERIEVRELGPGRA